MTEDCTGIEFTVTAGNIAKRKEPKSQCEYRYMSQNKIISAQPIRQPWILIEEKEKQI